MTMIARRQLRTPRQSICESKRDRNPSCAAGHTYCAMFSAAAAVRKPLAAGKRKRQTLPGGPEAAMTLLSGGAACDDDEMKYGEAGDAATAPQKRLFPPWTVEEDAILLRIRKQYDAGELTSHAAFAQAASDALGGKRTPEACYTRCSKLFREPLPGSARACIPWSLDKDSVLRRLVDRWHANQFAGAQSFYDEAVKQLAGRSFKAIQSRLRILELTVPSDGKHGGGPLWSQSESDILMDIYRQCNAGQFGSGEKLLEHVAERLPGRSAHACCDQLRKLGHGVPQLLQQVVNAARRAAFAAAKRDEHGAAVALKIKPPLWLPEEDSVLKLLMSQLRKKQFASAQEFYDEAAKRLPRRSSQAIEARLHRHHKITHPPSSRNYKPADQHNARALPPAHAASAADVAAVVKGDISDDAPLPAQPQSTLPPPPLWMIRNSATGKTSGPFLISVLRHGVAEGRISAKDMLAWRQYEGESAAISLQAALDLPRIPSRSQQMTRARAR